MASRLRRPRTLVVLSVLLMVAAGGVTFALLTTETQLRVCTRMSPAPSGVAVIVREREAGPLVRGRACLGSRCRSLRRGRYIAGVWLAGFPVARRPGTHPVVVVLERAGQPAEVMSRRVTLERTEENGPGCGTEWQGVVRYAQGKLVQVPFSERERYVRGG